MCARRVMPHTIWTTSSDSVQVTNKLCSIRVRGVHIVTHIVDGARENGKTQKIVFETGEETWTKVWKMNPQS